MVAGHLQEKNGIYYVVLTYKTYDGKRKTKWQSTGLPTKGNKKRAEAMMRELQTILNHLLTRTAHPAKQCCSRIFWYNGWKSPSQPSS